MRPITYYEKRLVSFLLKQANYQVTIPPIVITMQDGGMGSISFDLRGDQSRDYQIIEGIFNDKDGTPVSFELTADAKGNLFELDLWKVDFSPLISLPDESEIKIITHKD